MTTNEKALLLHEEWRRKLKTTSKTKVTSREDLALTYIPGAVKPRKAIAVDPEVAHWYTIESNTITVVLGGSAILGLGNTGPLAAMLVTEGKAVLFKEFGGVNAFPICLDTQDIQEVIKIVMCIVPALGGINLESISAPRCFEIKEALKERLGVPVFHGDQCGTAIVVLVGVINPLKLTGKKKEGCRVIASSAGSAGIAITKLLLIHGFAHITMCDRSGILSKGADDPNWTQEKMMDVTNLDHGIDTLTDVMKGVGIFVDVSAPEIVTQDMVAFMDKDAILLAVTDPVPEIVPELAKTAGARVAGAGCSDLPSQVNNMVVFPGTFRGTLEGRASAITEKMKLAAAEAIAGLVDGENLNDEDILPEAFDPHVADVVGSTVEDHIRK